MKPSAQSLDPTLDTAVLVEQLRLLVHKRVDLAIDLVIAGIVTVVLRPFYPVWVTASWLSAFCLVILGRALIRRHYRRSAPEAGAAVWWGRLFAMNAFASSCLWGLTGSVVLVTPDPLYHVFIVFVLGGMMAAGLVANAAYLPAICRQAKAWLDAGTPPPRISVNVSALQFKTSRALERDVRAVLLETGLPPALLELELTETALMDDSLERSETLERLREIGVSLAIDDFGTGYSSLEYLRRFTVERVKIARSFITRLATAPRDAAIVKATIALFQELGIRVIAEGVETEAQYAFLKAWGCDEVQGFYFAPPLPVDDISRILRDGDDLQPSVRLETVA